MFPKVGLASWIVWPEDAGYQVLNGMPSWTLLVKLYAEKVRSRFLLSPSLTRLESDASQLRLPWERTSLKVRGEVPGTNGLDGWAKQFGKNHWVEVCGAPFAGSQVRFGRWLRYWSVKPGETTRGTPPPGLTTLFTVQPPKTPFTARRWTGLMHGRGPLAGHKTSARRATN